jgi:serine/threonine-protein kinase
MSEDEARKLLGLAEAVADGSPVDWDHTDPSLAESSGKVRHLQLVEKIRLAHRSIGDLAGDTDASPTEATPTRWGSLEIIGSIGIGGFGEVYLAYDPALQRDVALKLLHPHREGTDPTDEAFLSEARKLARVRHSNVLTVHGAGRHDGRVGLWADLLKGKTLEDCLRERGAFGAEEAALIGVDVCRALAAVHAAGLVHRDVKTGNVMREDGGRIVLVDFSSVTERAEGERSSVPGTPIYMAPELFRGQDSGTSSDIYSLGVLLYRLVTCRYPVDGTSVADLRGKHARGESTPLRDVRPDLPTAFVQVVERALMADPAERYGSMGEMERDLARAIGSTPQDDVPLPEPRPSPRPLWFAAVAVGIALALALVLFWETWFGDLTVEASLFRAGDGVEERLLPGGLVVPGDHLFLEISGSRPMHVYVLNEDEAGRQFLLFPLPGLDLQNPLDADVRHRLPGAAGGVLNDWELTSAGGEEIILVIASVDPLVDLESELEGITPAGSALPTEVVHEGVLDTLRGIGGVSPTPSASGGADGGISEISRRLSEKAAGASWLWIWETTLRSLERAPEETP